MKYKNQNSDAATAVKDYHLQKSRILKILDETIYKLSLLIGFGQTHLPHLLENETEMLRKHLSKTQVDFILFVCQETIAPVKRSEIRSDLNLIFNMLDKVNLNEKKILINKKNKNPAKSDACDTHVAYALDIIFSCPALVKYLEGLDEEVDSVMVAFVHTMHQLSRVVRDRLSISAVEEIKKENELKTAYRAGMMLSENIEELEFFLDKQRQELGREHKRKESILQDLDEEIVRLKEKSVSDISRLIYDSEVAMMKDYNRSIESLELLAEDAADSTRKYESLLEENLAKEKVLRAKRLKIESQLASWVTKYDTDIGEKQAELDKLQKEYREKKQELDLMQQMFKEQEEEYVVLMEEKEKEEERIREETGWIFLQNRSARRIQIAWRAYRERKLARKKARKSKQKGEKKGGAKGKKDKKGERMSLKGGPDPNALLESKLGGSVFEDVKTDSTAFTERDVKVEL